MKDTLKALVQSRKFILALVCVTVVTVLVAMGKIDADDFVKYVLGIFGGLAALIGFEDAAEKHGAASTRTSGNPPAPKGGPGATALVLLVALVIAAAASACGSSSAEENQAALCGATQLACTACETAQRTYCGGDQVETTGGEQ